MALVGGKIQIRTIYHLQTMSTLNKKGTDFSVLFLILHLAYIWYGV